MVSEINRRYMLQWTERKLPLNELKPYERNPRRISKEAFSKLKASLEASGYHQRILCQPDGSVIGGHQRIRAMKELGITEVTVLTPNRELTTEEFRRILVQDNIPFGQFDMDILSADFDLDELKEWGMPDEWLTGKLFDEEFDDEKADQVPESAEAYLAITDCSVVTARKRITSINY
jgi:hypothetical protein